MYYSCIFNSFRVIYRFDEPGLFKLMKYSCDALYFDINMSLIIDIYLLIHVFAYYKPDGQGAR